MLYKIAAKYAISELSSSDLNLLFPSIQVGVGVRGGAERAAHLVQSWLETGPDDSVLIMLDFSNAFNSCSRQKNAGNIPLPQCPPALSAPLPLGIP